ncbi:MAG: ATP-binding cassette domain-containing protein [Gloeotrichia echinulata IR180]|jgi:putative ABC transport system ATP-binding protein|nr:ATP-binding cassette domain-containing protein [Gloeotrichia echinulata DEX184]
MLLQEPVVSIKNLQHYLGKGALRKRVLSDINFEIQRGEFIILTGPSGSGKTTLLTLIGALRTIQSGSIKVFEHELYQTSNYQLVQVRRKIGYIFQSNNLLPFLTAVQNVLTSIFLHKEISKAEAYDRAVDMLESVGLGKYLNSYPRNLSGGQQQRVAIARALAPSPKLILADEPTAALDKKTGRDVIELMLTLTKQINCTILLITHDSRILDVAERIIYMEDGNLINTNVSFNDNINALNE